MRTFAFRDGKSDKFWNIELEGTAFTVTYGRTGARGQTQTKNFATPAKAQAAHDKLVQEKLGKGYVETTAPTGPAAMLERAILDDPDDLAARAAYADILMEQGDPRGEFIQVQLTLAEENRPAEECKQLQKREWELLKEHQTAWLGALAPFLENSWSIRPTEEEEGEEIEYSYEFARGWLDSLTVPELSLDFAEVLSAAPEARMLNSLVLENWYYDQEPTDRQRTRYRIPENNGFPSLYPLLGSASLANLRVFQLGVKPDDTIEQHSGGYIGLADNFRCHTGGGELVTALVQLMPRLEELYLFANDLRLVDLFALKTIQKLRVLQIYHAWDYPLEILADNPAFANLTHLLLHPKASGHWNDDCPYIKFDGVRAILRSRHLQKLTHLQLRLTDIGDRGCQEIVDSGILKRLKSLDLRHGCITDAGARILAACPDVKNLDVLDLSRNRLSKPGVRELAAAAKSLRADYQQTPEEWANQDEENQYLFEGDYE